MSVSFDVHDDERTTRAWISCGDPHQYHPRPSTAVSVEGDELDEALTTEYLFVLAPRRTHLGCAVFPIPRLVRHAMTRVLRCDE